MRTWFRKAAPAVALSVVLTIGAGCGSSSKPAAKAPAQTKQVELNLLAFPGVSLEALGDINHEFEAKNPGTRVRIKDQQGLQLFGQGGVNSSALDGIDIVLLPTGILGGMAENGLVRDLSAIKVPKLNDLVAGVYDDLGQVGGKRYGLPVSITPVLLLINEQQLARANVKIPTADWTWQEFEQILSATKAAGANNQVLINAILEPIIRSYGGMLYDADTKAWAFDSAEAKQALGMLASMTTKELVNMQPGGPIRIAGGPGGGGGGQGGPGLAASAPAITAIGGGGGAFFVGAGGGSTTQLPFPRGPKGSASPAQANVAAVVASSISPEMATEYVKFLLTSQAQQYLGKGGLRPVIADAKALSTWQERVGEQRAKAIEAGLQGAYVTQTPSLTDVLSGLNPYLTGKAALEPTVSNLMSKLK